MTETTKSATTPTHRQSQTEQRHRDAIERYTSQPARLPTALRDRIEAAFEGDPVQLYGMADLDASLDLNEAWIAVGPRHFAVARRKITSREPQKETGRANRPHDKGHVAAEDFDVRTFNRSAVTATRETPGLSCTTLTIQGAPDDPPLATLRYTHRQQRALANVKWVLDPESEGSNTRLDNSDAVYARAVARPIEEAQALVAKGNLTVMWRLIGYLYPYRFAVAAGMAGAALLTALGLIPPYLLRVLIDDVLTPFGAGALPAADAAETAYWLLGILVAAVVLREVCMYIRLRTMAVLGEAVARDLRRELYEHLQKLSVSFFSSKQTGSIISRVGSDTDRIWDFVAFGIIEASISVVMMVGLSAMLIALDWQLGLLVSVPIPFVIWALAVNGRKLNKFFLRCWRKWSDMTDVLSDTIPGIRVVKAFNQEDHEKERFGQRNESFTEEAFTVHRIWTRFWPVLMLAVQGLVVVVWFFALPRLIPGGGLEPTLTQGTFVAFLLYLGMFMYPVEVLGQVTRMMNRATSSAYRIFEVLDTEPELIDVSAPQQLDPVKGRIEFQEVSFAYDSVRPVLKNVSFAVEPGEMIGLVGPSGAGKTTVINLIARFYDPTAGRVLVDGVDLREVDTGHYRKQIGMVLQDPFLFHGTVLNNIRYGLRDCTIEQVIEAARAANAHDFICKLPHGYDTIVGERGHTLSGGERQRVSIARAILHNPRILILDEATSSVDTETERKIQEALDRLVADRTVLAIAHRLSTLKRATRLIGLKDGKIVEVGTHAELLAREDGLYKKLHSMQQELHEMYAV